MKRPRISLRTALILLTLVGAGCGLVARWLAQAERQRVARLKLEENGVRCIFMFGAGAYDIQPAAPTAPAWLIDLVGLDALYPVEVHIEKPLDEASLGYLSDLKLQTVRVWSVGNSADAILEVVSRQSALSALFLENSDVSDAGLANLAHLPRLKGISLSGSSFTGSGLLNLEAPLEHLVADCPAFNDDGMRQVGRFRELRTLSLTSEAVTDDGLRHLKNLAELDYLTLQTPQVTDRGLRALANLNTIRDLWVSGPHVGRDDLTWLVNLSQLTFLVLEGSLTDATLPTIGQLKQLQELEISEIYGPLQATGRGMSKLKNMSSLTGLSVPPELLSDEAMPAIAEMTSLTSLDLTGASITDAGLTHIKNLTGLVELALDSPDVTDQGVREICQLRQLENLHLAGCMVSREGVAELPKLARLTSLGLGGQQLDLAALEPLRQLKELEYLEISTCGVAEEIMPLLLSLPKLRRANTSFGTLERDDLRKARSRGN